MNLLKVLDWPWSRKDFSLEWLIAITELLRQASLSLGVVRWGKDCWKEWLSSGISCWTIFYREVFLSCCQHVSPLPLMLGHKQKIWKQGWQLHHWNWCHLQGKTDHDSFIHFAKWVNLMNFVSRTCRTPVILYLLFSFVAGLKHFL